MVSIIAKKQLIVLLAALTFFTSLPGAAKAALTVQEIYDPYDLVTVAPHYDAQKDGILVYIRGSYALKVRYTSPAKVVELTPDMYGWDYFVGMSFSCNSDFNKGELFDGANKLILRVTFSTNDIKNDACTSDREPIEEPHPASQAQHDGSLQKCDSCALLNCPGWGEYMDKLDDIKNAIPPEPNWKSVSETFRDTIVPKLVNDVGTMLGSAPSPPAAAPKPPKLDTNTGIPELEGGNAPGLEDSGFDAGDIKDKAPKIEFKEDESGGFDITDPVENLPETPDLKPKEPDEDAPMPKEDDEEAPNPKDDNAEAPTPKDEDAEAPSPKDDGAEAPNPKDDSAEAPSPKDDGAAAPSPKDDGATAPTPKDNSEAAPSPKDDGATAPTPSDGSASPPVPSGGDATPPRPSGSSDFNAPMPGNSDFNAPTPSGSGFNAPMPGGGG